MNARVGRSVEVTVRDSAEYGGQNTRSDKGTNQRLNENGVLDLSKCWLLDPDLTIKDFTNDVALLILGDPRFVLVAVAVVADE